MDPVTRKFVTIVATLTGAVLVLGIGAAFIYALLIGQISVPETVANGFWQVVISLFTLILVVVLPFVRDAFARSQRELTQRKIETTQQTIETTHQAVQKLQETVDNGLAASVASQVGADARVVAAQLAAHNAVPDPQALAENTAAVRQATNAIDANTDAQGGG